MSLKQKVAELVGADRAKIIVVIAVNRSAAQKSILWLQSEGIAGFPYWCFCAEDCESIPGFDRFASRATAHQIGVELKAQWCALTVISWTGEPGYARLKLAPLFRPPFRFLFLNDSGDFFGPRFIPAHAVRRLGEAWHNFTQTVKDIALASPGWLGREIRHLADWSWSALKWIGRLSIPIRDRIRATLIYLFAFFAQLSTPLSRAVFNRFKGLTHIDLDLPPITDLSYIEVRVHGRNWPFAEIEQTISRATASIILFRQDGETAAPDKLLAAFREPATFAAGLQIQKTDWRKKLLPKFPFRGLQPEEVCCTLAPYSSLLAVRRDALLQFGIPKVLSSGSAYLLLCWQAAAAGLDSYTVGAARPPGDEVDVPLEHAEFVKVLLEKKKLRELTPANPALSRGNVATSWQHRQPFTGRLVTGKPRVLLLSPYLPYPLSHGGAVRIFNLCRVLADRIDFVLVCFREATDTVRYDVLSGIFREIHVVDNDEKHRTGNLPRQVSEYRNSAMRALVRNLCETRKIDLVQIEYTQMAEYRDCAGSIPVLLVEHDVTFTLYRQIAGAKRVAKSQAEYRRWLEFETKALRDANCVWAMSNHDRRLILEQGASPERTFTVPNGVDLERFQPQPKAGSQPCVLLVGSFRHLPNLLAFEALRERIMPVVWETIPDAQLHVIAGPRHEICVREAGKEAVLQFDPRISVEGFVEDVRPAYGNADVVVIPLPVSAGTNIKLMEAMACGRAIVSTPVGCIGLDLRDEIDLLIRPIEFGFAEAIIRLLNDSNVRQHIAETGRRTAENRFGWNAVARAAIESYESILAAGGLITRSQSASTTKLQSPSRAPDGLGKSESRFATNPPVSRNRH